jgi:hypothetical protein
MEEDNKLNYEKEVADMEALIKVLIELKDVKQHLSEWNEIQANMANAEGLSSDVPHENADLRYYRPNYYEHREKSLEKKIEVFQLDAEIEQKQMVLAELKRRVEENIKTTEIFAKEADESLDSKIKRAKALADDERVPKDVRRKIKSAFVDPYQTRHRYGFSDDQMKAGFYKALIQIIEAAENWTITKK